MATIKGPAIPEDTFDMTGHCCGARYTGIKNLTEQGFRFELTEEARKYLREQGIEVPASQTPSAEHAPPVEQTALAEKDTTDNPDR